MCIYPKEYFDSVTDITIEFTKKNNLKGLILDVDNTLIDYNQNLDEKIIKWCKELKDENIKICILSNTNKIEKVTKVANALDLKFYYFAKKPLKFGFKKAQKYLNIDAKNIGVVGDQIFTDVIGSNRMKMFPILVKPLAEKDIWVTRFKRPIENLVIKSYMKKKNEGKI